MLLSVATLTGKHRVHRSEDVFKCFSRSNGNEPCSGLRCNFQSDCVALAFEYFDLLLDLLLLHGCTMQRKI